MENLLIKRSISNCLTCENPPCSLACKHNVDPGKVLRSLKFKNYQGAIENLSDYCLNCDAPCINSCVIPNSVNIKDIISKCIEEKKKFNPEFKHVSLETDFCGFKLENPFLLSSSVVASTYDMCRRALLAGWAGVCFKTICLFDIHEASPRFSALKNNDGSFSAFKNIEQLSDHSLVENFEIFRKLKKEFPNKFLLVSIMGRDEKEWKYLAREAQKAGADALELNFSCPNMTEDNTGSDVGQIPELVEKYTRAVKEEVNIPVISKLTPNVASPLPAAIAAKNGGADGIAAINTIKSITEFNIIDSLYNKKLGKNIAVGGLSGSAVKPIALKFIAEIAKEEELKNLHISAMGGIYTYEDAIMFLALGASSLQVTTAVMEYGYRIIDDLINGLELFLGTVGLHSLSELKGGLINNVVNIEKIERDYVIYPKFIRNTCVGCGRCYISCLDGGHQAIKFENRIPILDPKKCVGCHLCVLVCPTSSIVSSEIKIKK